MQKRNKSEIDHFTKLDHIWWGAKTVAGQKRYDRRFELFKKRCKPSKKRILEIGCGDGEFTRRLIDLQAEIVGIDITPKVIEKAKKEFKKKKVKFVVGNIEKLKYRSNTFDIVCGISILHHVDTEKSLQEAYRVLKKDGQLFFSEPNLLNPHILLGLNIPWLRKKMEYSPDEVALIRWKMVKMLRDIGFSFVEVVNYDFLHPKTPSGLINIVEKASDSLEKIPLVKEISGSLIIYARK